MLSTLAYVHGFDIPVDNVAANHAALHMARDVAAHFAQRLIHVATNLRVLKTRARLSWPDHLFGPALAAVAQGLSPVIGTVYIPGEYISTQGITGAAECELPG